MAAVRTARAQWDGDLAAGRGRVSSVSSGTFQDLPVSWAARTESPNGRTSPEELLAAAHASCFAMALAAGLGQADQPPQRLEVEAQVTFDKRDGGWQVVSSEISVRGRVPGADAEAFRQAAEAAKDGCPISQALKGNVRLSVSATLT